MALTLGEAITKSIKLIDEYSINGKVITDIKNADYLNKMKDASDTVQMELAEIRKIPAVYEIIQTPIVNLLASKPTQQIVYHTDHDIVYSALLGTSFYFEVDNLATIYIRQGANILQTITNTGQGKWYPYKNFIVGADPTLNVELVFSGSNYYNIRFIALYKTPFPTVNDIPRDSVKRRYDMPPDYMDIENPVLEDIDENFITQLDYHWENPKTLILDADVEGTVRVNYFRYPTRITEATPLTYEFELVPEASNIIPYYLAWNSKSTEDPPLANQFRRIYEIMRDSLEKPADAGIVVMQDVNNW